MYDRGGRRERSVESAAWGLDLPRNVTRTNYTPGATLPAQEGRSPLVSFIAYNTLLRRVAQGRDPGRRSIGIVAGRSSRRRPSYFPRRCTRQPGIKRKLLFRLDKEGDRQIVTFKPPPPETPRSKLRRIGKQVSPPTFHPPPAPAPLTDIPPFVCH